MCICVFKHNKMRKRTYFRCTYFLIFSKYKIFTSSCTWMVTMFKLPKHLQMINFLDFLEFLQLSRASFTFVLGHQAVLIAQPWKCYWLQDQTVLFLTTEMSQKSWTHKVIPIHCKPPCFPQNTIIHDEAFRPLRSVNA